MKRFLYAISILLFALFVLFTAPAPARASEGDGGNELKAEVNGYHITLDSRNEWAKGENTLAVTITDRMGMPLTGADVEILIAPKEGGHDDSGADSHNEAEGESMPGMDMGDDHSQEPEPGVMKPDANNHSGHDEETASPITMTESEHGTYTTQIHLETSGKHDAHVMFHVNGGMLQADFTVTVTGAGSKSVVLWGFVLINVAVIASAGMLKKQKSLVVKGAQ